MKKLSLKITLIVLLAIGFATTSCSNEADGDTSANEIDLKTAESEAEIDNISDETSSIIEDAFLTEETIEPKSNATYRYLPDCVTITATIQQNLKNVTIDFGDGCELRNGNTVKGIITIQYEIDASALTKTITYAYDDFYFNDNLVEGGGSIFREWLNSNGNPQSTKTFDIKVTWPSGEYASKTGTRIKEWVEGSNTLVWGDNVFLITGNWSFTKFDGTVLAVEVKEALRREWSCRFFVSGLVQISKNDNIADLDYGDGECDDLATVSINGGEPTEIHLSNFRK